MKKQLLLLAAACLLGMSNLTAQTNGRNCGTMGHLQQQLNADPTLQQRMDQVEQFTQNYLASQAALKTTTVVTIPVVFHVLYSTNNATQNISDARINEQLHVLNLDYSRTNADAGNTPAVFQGISVNTNIQFCLAVRDPNGAATTGIIRKLTGTTSFIDDDGVKFNAQGGDDAWPAGSYLNLWVCNLGGGLLGYAQFPGGPANTDGVVVLNESVGGPAAPGTATSYNLGRTATHEVGHWLNLRHVWGDANCGNDLVSDTPTQQTSNFGCPSFPHVTCSNGPNGDMFMNYMDYVDDNCMNAFTAGQSSRSNALLISGGARFSLTTSQGCSPVGGGCGIPGSLSATSVAQTSATVNWGAVSGATTYTLQYRVSGGTLTTVGNLTTTSKALSGLTAGTVYDYHVKAVCSGTSGTYSAYSHFTTTSGGGCGIPGSLTATSITATSATLSWGAVSGATTYTLQYRVSGGALTTVGNLATTSKALSGLSANTVYDYHVKAVCSGTSGTYSAYSHFTTTTGGTGCVTPDPYEPNGGKAAAKPIAVNTLIYAVINNATDKDWYSFTTTTAAPKIKIVLNTLPFDYDVKLFNTAGTQIAISDNSGTTAETIIYNAATTGATYYVQVYGYSGVYNATSCYHLKVNTRATNYRLDDAIVADVEHTGDISLYPNPANDQLTISLTSDANQTSRISIIDMLGHTALSTESELSEGDNKVDIDLSALQNGVYFVQVICNGEKTIQKLVIQK